MIEDGPSARSKSVSYWRFSKPGSCRACQPDAIAFSMRLLMVSASIITSCQGAEARVKLSNEDALAISRRTHLQLLLPPPRFRPASAASFLNIFLALLCRFHQLGKGCNPFLNETLLERLNQLLYDCFFRYAIGFSSAGLRETLVMYRQRSAGSPTIASLKFVVGTKVAFEYILYRDTSNSLSWPGHIDHVKVCYKHFADN